MHLDLFLRGKIEFVALWEAHVQAQYLKFRRTNIKTGKEEERLVQLGLRKGVLGSYELVFPKEALIEVLAMLGVLNSNPYGRFKDAVKMEVIRKIFGDKKIDNKTWKEVEQLKTKTSMIIKGRERGLADCKTPGVATHVIGIKEDKFGTVDGEYYHELL